MRRWTSVVLVALALSLVACGGPPSEAFRLSLNPQGTLELRIERCVEAMSIWVQQASDDWTRPAWHIAAKNYRTDTPTAIVVGEVPHGWREMTRLQHDLEPGVRYTVRIGSGESYQENFDFAIGDLKPGYVLDFTNDLVPEDEFPTASACPTKSTSVAS